VWFAKEQKGNHKGKKAQKAAFSLASATSGRQEGGPSLGELLVGFFRYFGPGGGFDFATHAVVTHTVGVAPKAALWPLPRLWRFSIRDPFDLMHDLGTVLSEVGWKKVRRELGRARDLLLGPGGDALLLVGMRTGGDAGGGAGGAAAQAAKAPAKGKKPKKPRKNRELRKKDKQPQAAGAAEGGGGEGGGKGGGGEGGGKGGANNKRAGKGGRGRGRGRGGKQAGLQKGVDFTVLANAGD